MKYKLSKQAWESIGKTAGWMDEEMEDVVGGDLEEYTLEKPFEYYINLNERGEFYADVRNPQGETVLEIKGFDIFEDGFMKHDKDIQGLREYLVYLGIMNEDQDLVSGN